MKSPIHLLIADDHHIVLDGIVSLLKDEKTISISATAHNGVEVLDELEHRNIDVCLMDISMPRMDGIATARQLRVKWPSVKIIILTTYNDREFIDELSQVGVNGYLLKNCTKHELVDAIVQVSEGNTFFSPEIKNAIITHFSASAKNKSGKVVLTQREIEILRLLAQEYTNEKIANELKISFRTVETHRKNMMQKTKAHNLAGLLNFAYANGIFK